LNVGARTAEVLISSKKLRALVDKTEGCNIPGYNSSFSIFEI